MRDSDEKKRGNPIHHIPLPFDEVIGDVLKIKPPPKTKRIVKKRTQKNQKTKIR